MVLFLSELLVIYYTLEHIWLYKHFYRRGTSLATKSPPCHHQCNPNGPITYWGTSPTQVSHFLVWGNSLRKASMGALWSSKDLAPFGASISLWLLPGNVCSFIAIWIQLVGKRMKLSLLGFFSSSYIPSLLPSSSQCRERQIGIGNATSLQILWVPKFYFRGIPPL